jgi:dipeptidyl-peptidase-2
VESWNYQACTELVLEPITSDGLGFYPPADGEDTDRMIRRCREEFGVLADPAEMGVRYGRGRDYTEHLTNTLLVENSRDPWRVGTESVGENRERGLYKFMAEGGAHHQDLRFERAAACAGVTAAWRFESVVITGWREVGAVGGF